MSFARFRPRILDSLKGYTRQDFWADFGAGVTVGVVALPLAMAFAIASGLKPEAGLWTAIIAGFLVSALGGTRMQIGGPAGAFIVVVYAIVERFGVASLAVCTLASGMLLFVLGWFRLGRYVRFVPVAIVIGFTNGIAVLIALSQLKDFFGLPIAKMPADAFGQLAALAARADQVNWTAAGLGALAVLGLFVWPRLWDARSRLHLHAFEGRTIRMGQRLPGPLLALVSLSALAFALHLPVETIGSKFGSIAQELPKLAWPAVSLATLSQLLPSILTLTALGAIESLLCARVADQVAHARGNDRHNPDQELMAQGIANLVSPLFGGMPATGTIARTVTNIRSGARSGVAGIVHAATLVLVVLLAAPVAVHVPLCVLAGVLLYVAWNMGEWHEFARAKSFSNHYRILLLGTFGITVVFDLMLAIELGLVAACALFVRRMSTLFSVQAVAGPSDQLRFTLHGALFFGALAGLEPIVSAIESSANAPSLTVDATHLIQLDTSGLDALWQIAQSVQERGGKFSLHSLAAQPASLVARSGLAFQGVDAAA